ncbi:cytochrome c oxidase subunit 5B, mitochondrial [Halyomorpha halys]|uniref:cytochrome c oxidase subunit 5B, mitochondrial n=1 Tax=Halyomorpha halys TaxID=286706 RepID=UPI0006D5261E|nr:cytochrome c oxidase subunit 5B, mitochondrial [Halyomorpha halys]
MATLCSRFSVISRRFSASRILATNMADPLEHATGLEKRELLARVAGNDNPFDFRVLKRGPGTRDCPNQVPSSFDSRLVGCICEEEASSIQWMWLHQGCPRRCACGHWFQLVYKAPV